MLKNLKKVSALGTVFLGVALILGACSSSNNNSGNSNNSGKKTLNWMNTAELETLDPSKMVDVTSDEQALNSLEGLNRMGNNGKIYPGIATKTVQSKNGLTWTFTLRKNAKWSNGDPVTAKDFVYSLQRTLNPATRST